MWSLLQYWETKCHCLGWGQYEKLRKEKKPSNRTFFWGSYSWTLWFIGKLFEADTQVWIVFPNIRSNRCCTSFFLIENKPKWYLYRTALKMYLHKKRGRYDGMMSEAGIKLMLLVLLKIAKSEVTVIYYKVGYHVEGKLTGQNDAYKVISWQLIST